MTTMSSTTSIRSNDVLRNMDGVQKFGCIDAKGFWTALLDAGENVLMRVQFRRFTTNHMTPISHHLQCTNPPISHVSVFVTPDEHMMGRCATVQHSNESGRIARVQIDIADSRLTAERLTSLLTSVQKAVEADQATDSLRNQEGSSVRRAMDTVMVLWPPQPAPLEPDMRMLLETGPQPAVLRADGVVSLAGGGLLVSTLDPETAQRCVKWSDRAREDHLEPFNIVERARSGICSGTRDTVVLVSQRSGVGECVASVLDEGRSTFVLMGVPMAQVCALVHDLYFQISHMFGEWYLLGRPVTYEDLAFDQELAVERREAAATIRALVVQDEVVKNIKARVWRPGGRLVAKMMLNRD